MRQISWELADGFPLDQGAMKFIQDEIFDRLMATITYWQNSLSENHFIITGMDRVGLSGETISAGWCFLGGKLLYYPGGAYPGNGCVIRPVLSETNVEYQDGVDRPAYKYWTATVMLGGSGEGMLFQGAKRVPKIQALTWANLAGIPTNIVYDSNYVHTDNNFTNALLAKLNGIESGAEQNVQSDWNETNPNSDAFIRNKPIWFRPVMEGSVGVSFSVVENSVVGVTAEGQLIGATATNYNNGFTTVTVNFPTTENYMVHMVPQGITTSGLNWSSLVTAQIVRDSLTSNELKFTLRNHDTGPLFILKIDLKLLAI